MEDKIAAYYNKTKSETPDGLMDASSYIAIVKKIVEATSYLNPNNDEDEGMFIVEIMNAFISSDGNDIDFNVDKGMETITALSFVITMMSKFASEIDNNFLEGFIRVTNDVVIPQLEAQSKAVPYWNE